METMSEKARLLDLFEGNRHQKVILTVSAIAILVLELIIYMTFASQAGHKSYVIVSDREGNVVYETQGSAITSYEKLVFENTFGPIQNYRIQVRSESNAFPFRAWLTAAVGIPIGLILLMAFLVKAFLSLVYGEEKEKTADGDAPSPLGMKSTFGSVFSLIGRISIFHVGFLIVIGVLLFWIVPNFLGDFARGALSLIKEFKWVFTGLGIFLAFLVVWVIYLRYKLSRRMLDNQLDLEKYRVEKQLLLQDEKTLLITSPVSSEVVSDVEENQPGV